MCNSLNGVRGGGGEGGNILTSWSVWINICNYNRRGSGNRLINHLRSLNILNHDVGDHKDEKVVSWTQAGAWDGRRNRVEEKQQGITDMNEKGTLNETQTQRAFPI